MRGWEHYREAERLLGLIRKLPEPDPNSPTPAEDANAVITGAASIALQAQVHATLAVASSSVLWPAPPGVDDLNSDITIGVGS